MIELGPHAGYIIFSYLGALAIVSALIAYVLVSAKRVESRLKSLEARGIRRRSASSDGATSG
jgi:heme exporter protein D